MLAPHTGRGMLRFANHAHGPFFIMPSQVDRKQLVLQTIIISVAAVVIVNLFPRRGRKWAGSHTFTKSARARINAALI